MVNGQKLGKNIFLTMVFAMGLCCVGFLACGCSKESDPESKSTDKSVAPSSQETDLPSSRDNSQAIKKISAIPTGWKTFSFEGWSMSLPSNWSGDIDCGTWWPEGGNPLGHPIPPISVFSGDIPLMPGTGFEERIITHIGTKPQEKENVTVSGLSGFRCSWEVSESKHLGLFLEEKVGGGMSIIHFVDCQAPTSDFDQHKGDFEKILACVKK